MRRELADEARRDREHADILGCMHGDGNHYWPPPGNQFDQWELTELTRRNDEACDRAKANGQPAPEPMLRLPDSAYEARSNWRYMSRRTKPLPRNWQTTRRRILRRDNGICYVCRTPGANQVDHIIPVSQGGGEQDSNLAAIHEYPCHAAKTAREANAANPMAKPRRRPSERHPGMIE